MRSTPGIGGPMGGKKCQRNETTLLKLAVGKNPDRAFKRADQQVSRSMRMK